ncbi:MAG: hypothetical protein ISQ14_01035 [Verrucomicrobiae bacterium]|nr:hypothetical protein [Verrucomicrobiae bacterium]
MAGTGEFQVVGRVKAIFWAVLVVFFLQFDFCAKGAEVTAGPLVHDFPLTLESGSRREAAGPFFYRQTVGTRSTLAVPPLFSWLNDPVLEYQEFDLLYPLLTYDRFGLESRVQLLQMLSLSGSSDQDSDVRSKFTIFPFYFQQRSTNSAKNYTALFPFYGTLRNRILRDEISFVLFPMYSKTRKRDVVTRNYLYPFFHLREGSALRGWQFWPLVGRESRETHTVTNRFGTEDLVLGERTDFVLWPFFLKHDSGIGGTNEVHETSFLPFASFTRSPARDSSSVIWPFFRYTDDREKSYREWGFPWPLWGIARGEGKQMNRLWPLFSKATNGELTSQWYLWPFWRRDSIDVPPLQRQRTRLLFFLYNDLVERSTVTGREMHRRDLWPLFHYRKQTDGRERLQVLALLEPLLPNNKSIERNWSPLWSIWRSEKDPSNNRRSDSFLWNLWRREVSEEGRSNSYFFGLLSNRKTADATRWSWFDPLQEGSEAKAEAAPISIWKIDPIRLRPSGIETSVVGG